MEIHRLVVGPLEVNCYLLFDPESKAALVVDPGAEPEAILAELARLGARVEGIVNTHFHIDHVGSNAHLHEATGAPLMIGRADAPMLARNFDMGLTRVLRSRPSPPPDRLLDHGDRIELAGEALEVRACPGHSPGGLCLAGDGFVLAGDSLFAGSIGRTDFPGCSHEALLDSIRRQIFSLADATVVLPGHGEPTTVGDERRSNPFVGEDTP